MRLKRFAAPKLWPIERKTKKYIISSRCGPHSKNAMPIGVILRDILKYADNMKEAKEILNKGLVRVDGRIRRDYKFPVGLMDILSLGNENYRVLPGRKGFVLQNTNEDANIKLLKVVNKTHVHGKIQLNLHDGRNLFAENDFKTGDVLVFDLKENKIKDTLKFKRGSIALITRGQNVGKIGKIEDMIIIKGPQPNKVVLKTDKLIEIPKDYVFIIGQNKPVVNIPAIEGENHANA